MKKTLWMTGVMMCAMVMFTACSDDDDDFKGNGEGVGNGGSGVVVKEKKLVRVEEQSSSSPNKYVTLFDYDAQGRLSKLSRTSENSNSSDDYTVVYGDKKITVIDEEDGEDEVYELNNDGYVVKHVTEYSGYRDECEYKYSGGYLNRVDYTYFEMENDKWVSSGNPEYKVLHVSGGNLKSVDHIFEYEEDGEKITDVGHSTIEVSNVANNMNIDFIYNGLFSYSNEYLLCITGERYQKLPARMESEGYVAEFEYTVDDEGYVREATVATKIGDYGYVEIYTFIYEE